MNNIDTTFIRVDAFRNLAKACTKTIELLLVVDHSNEINLSESERLALDDIFRARALELTQDWL
jgi:hypothetical protein